MTSAIAQQRNFCAPRIPFSSRGVAGWQASFPDPEVTLPIELKRELFPILSAQIRRQLRRRRLSERDVEADFEAWRKKRLAARRKR